MIVGPDLGRRQHGRQRPAGLCPVQPGEGAGAGAGVGEVEVFGSQYAMRVWLNPDKLTDYHLTIEDVIAALRAYNVEVSAGQFGGRRPWRASA
jgi:hypothetical protein